MISLKIGNKTQMLFKPRQALGTKFRTTEVCILASTSTPPHTHAEPPSKVAVWLETRGSAGEVVVGVE